MSHPTSLIAILSAGFVLAFILGMAAQKLRLSPLAGYLVAGIIAGPFTPGFVADQTLAPQLAEVGVILLMFGVGLHFSLDDLVAVKRYAIPGAIGQIVTTTLLGSALAPLLGWPWAHGLVFGLALSVASTVVVLRALEERRLLETQRGRIAIGWLVVEDLAMVLVLVLLPALAGALGGGADAGARDAASIAATLGWTLLKVIGFVATMLVIGKRTIPWLLEKVAGTGQRELFTLAVLAIALGVAFGSAALFDVSFALGAFFAGMLLNESELSHKAAADSLPLRDAFAVLFFVSVGMLFNPGVLLARPWLVLATFAIVTLGNATVALTLARTMGLPKLAAATLAVSMAQIGEFSFILAALGVGLGLLDELGRDLILAAALVSIIVNPFAFAWLDRYQARQEAATTTPTQAASAPDDRLYAIPAELAQHAIVVGYGRVGNQLARLLHARGVPLVVIEDEADKIAQARRDGFPAVRGNVAAEHVLEEARAAQAALVVFAIPRALEAGEAIARLKTALHPGIAVLARAHSDAEVRHLLERGADGTVLAERELACSLAEMVMSMPPYRGRRTEDRGQRTEDRGQMGVQ